MIPEPLSGITVLDMTVALQGPAAGVFLRDMGADVIKIEPPVGDSARAHRGVNNTTPQEALSPLYIAANRGKKSVCVDVHSDLGQQVIKRLLETCDVFLSNYRQSFLANIGLDYETLAPRHPQLIYAHVNGFGPKGPDSDKPMLDGAAQARGGLISVSGLPGATPMPPGAAIADTSGGMHLALGVMTALVARARHGKAQKVETSSLGTQLWLQSWELQHTMITGTPLRACGSHMDNIRGHYGVYDTKDGGAFMLALAMDEECWDALCIFAEMFEFVGDSDWNSTSKRLCSSGQGAPPEAAREILRRGFASKTTAEWEEFMYSQPDIIMERVRGYEDVITDEQNIANDYIVPMDMPVIGSSRVVGNLIHLSETPGSVKGPAPELGEHTREVMQSLGFGEHEIDAVNVRAEQARNEILQAIEKAERLSR